MALPYKVEIIKDPDEDGFAAYLPELKGCITTGLSEADALENLKDAKEVWFSSALENGDIIPEPESMKSYSGEFKLRMPKSLHRKLMEHSKNEGVSMNQYCIMLLSRNDVLAELSSFSSPSSL